MDTSRRADWIVGVFVLVGLLAIAYLSISVGGMSYTGKGGLTLYATFNEIGGLKLRAPVLIAGVKVGQVTAIELDKDYRARVRMDLDRDLELPVESSAAIRTAGILGDQFIHVSLGPGDEFLKNGEEFAFTEDAIVIENLIGKLINNLGIEKAKE